MWPSCTAVVAVFDAWWCASSRITSASLLGVCRRRTPEDTADSNASPVMGVLIAAVPPLVPEARGRGFG